MFLGRRAGVRASHTRWALCYSGSRLQQTEAFTWEDLQIIRTLPNYCRLDTTGFSPIVVDVPTNEVERIRWGIHSLCQHTMEAILHHTVGPPPPTWRRGQPALLARHCTEDSRKDAHGSRMDGAHKHSIRR